MVGLLVTLLLMVGIYSVVSKGKISLPALGGTRRSRRRSRAKVSASPAITSILNGLLAAIAAIAAATILSWAELGTATAIVLGAAIGVLAGVFSSAGLVLDLLYSMIALVATVPAFADLISTGDCFGPINRGDRIAALVVLGLCLGCGLIAAWYRSIGSLSRAGLGIFVVVEVLLTATMPIGDFGGGAAGSLMLLMVFVALLGGLVGFWAELVVPVLSAGLALVAFYDATVGLFPSCTTASSTAAVISIVSFAVALSVSRKLMP